MSRTFSPFVESSENRLGLGKLVDSENGICTVEYFKSPATDEQIIEQVDLSSLTKRVLDVETRVYLRNEDTRVFEIGRVLHFLKEDGCYLVRFPNSDSRLIPSDDLKVRCRLPIEEPTNHLASQVNETAFWHSARSNFVRHLIDQRRNSEGLTALLSSSIEIVAHQASVIRQVLLDPFQRYLLADEVGLGKTIEAGVLIKQLTLDAPDDHQTVVIVPEPLRMQWQQELTHRFHLGALIGETIHIIASHNERELTARLENSRMVVIDEAHHLSSWAWSSDPTEKAIYDMVATYASNLQRRILLLSATPVLHNEKSFLAMLHLLDPQVYPLGSLDTFKQRVHLRQEIAERMMDLREDESNFFLSDTLEVLGGLLTEDHEFQNLREKLTELIEEDVDEQDGTRIQLIRSIRTHVSDIWRLHRRILRNRRTDSTSAYLPGRGGAQSITYDCENEKGLTEAIEAWRLTLSASLFSADECDKKTATELAREMDELASCEPRKALELASTRLHDAVPNATRSLPLCEGETDALQQIIRAARDCDHAARLKKLYQLIGADEEQVSYVVFASEPETADLIYEFLGSRLPKDRVLRHSTNRFEWTRFKSERNGYVLVCDRTAEEGLNLQKRGACAIHYDLPFSPNRIEQRMGRLDRFGSGTPVQSTVLVCEGSSVQQFWFDLLDGALGVFNRSIACLQYVIEDVLQDMLSDFLDSGADVFAEASIRLAGEKGLVAKELKRIHAQDAIDSFDTDAFTREFVDEMENNDRKIGRASTQVFNDWVVRNLHFQTTGEENRADDVFTYEFTRRIDDGGRRPYGRDTLIPADEFKRGFAGSIDNVPLEKPVEYTTVPLTFDRVSSQRRSCRLVRIGDPFVDALETFTRWDDRGISYAFWRYAPSFQSEGDPEVFFKFDFVLSPGIDPLAKLCDQHAGASLNAVQRRTHGIMQPGFVTVWLDADLDVVLPNDERMKWVKPSFNKSRTSVWEDFNLSRCRWDAAALLYDMSLWHDRCLAARERSEKLLRENSGLLKLSEDRVAEAARQAKQVERQFHSRIATARGKRKFSLEAELCFESELFDAQAQAFRSPDIRADSVGAIFVSNQMPFVEHDEGEDDD